MVKTCKPVKILEINYFHHHTTSSYCIREKAKISLLTERVMLTAHLHGNVATAAYSGSLENPKLDYTICRGRHYDADYITESLH
jgi:hypothetical protein